MTMFNYESEELYQMTRGEISPSSPVYVADCKKEILTEVTPNYPKLSEYEKEWLSFAKNIYKDGTPVPLEYLEVQTDDEATVKNVIPFAYKSAILKGNTDENLQSVKMPVLKTVGKNLLSHTNINQTVNTNQNPTDIIYEDGGFHFNGSNNNWYSVWYDLNLKPNTKYTLSYHSNFMDCSIFKSTVNTYVASEIVSQVGIKNKDESHVQFTTLTFTSPNKGFVRIRLTNTQKNGYNVVTNLQLEEDSQATSYVPYQSNILTVNEEVALRSNGNVRDELDLLTGKLTQRIDENGEVLTQEVVKTVDLNRMIKPYEGTNHYTVSSHALPPLLLLIVPIESTGNKTLNDINTEE